MNKQTKMMRTFVVELSSKLEWHLDSWTVGWSDF